MQLPQHAKFPTYLMRRYQLVSIFVNVYMLIKPTSKFMISVSEVCDDNVDQNLEVVYFLPNKVIRGHIYCCESPGTGQIGSLCGRTCPLPRPWVRESQTDCGPWGWRDAGSLELEASSGPSQGPGPRRPRKLPVDRGRTGPAWPSADWRSSGLAWLH